jgi:tellurite resistance protein TehA-like permease
LRFPRKIRKDSRPQDNTSSKITSFGLSSILKRKWTIIVLGIVIAVIGFGGVIYFGSQYLNEEVTGGGTLPYTTPIVIKNISPENLEIVFVVIGMVGFGIFIYGIANRVDKPIDYVDE